MPFWLLLLFFWISNKFYWRKAKYTRRILGGRMQFQKRQESRNSSKLEKRNNHVANIQSNKVRKNNSFSSGTFCSHPSKVRALCYRHKNHIKQWGIALQIITFWCRPYFSCQQSNRSITLLGITQSKHGKHHIP